MRKFVEYLVSLMIVVGLVLAAIVLLNPSPPITPIKAPTPIFEQYCPNPYACPAKKDSNQ